VTASFNKQYSDYTIAVTIFSFFPSLLAASYIVGREWDLLSLRQVLWFSLEQCSVIIEGLFSLSTPHFLCMSVQWATSASFTTVFPSAFFVLINLGFCAHLYKIMKGILYFSAACRCMM